MKTILLSAASFICLSVCSQVKVPNHGFESLNANGTIKNWGKVTLLPVTMDSSGNPVDSFVFDSAFYFAVKGGAMGENALEMRNAFNYGTNQGFAGGANLSNNDTDYSGFGTNLVPVPRHIDNLNFVYKFFPVNNDSAVARMDAFDSNANLIGHLEIILSGTVSNFRPAYSGLTFTGSGPVAFVSISFSTFYSKVPLLRQPSFGTRLVVDEVTLINMVDIREQENAGRVKVYPNPASGHFSVSGITHIQSIQVFDAGGKELNSVTEDFSGIDVSALTPGIYFVKINTAEGVVMRSMAVE
jgi:hypothetical protein